MGKSIAGLTAVTVMRAAGEVFRPENSEVEGVLRMCVLAAGAATLNEVCASRAGSLSNLFGFPPARLEFPVSL